MTPKICFIAFKMNIILYENALLTRLLSVTLNGRAKVFTRVVIRLYDTTLSTEFSMALTFFH